MASSLLGLAKWADTQRDMRLELHKPATSLADPWDRGLPDLIVQGPGGRIMIQFAGEFDEVGDARLRGLGPVLRIPHQEGQQELSREELLTINKQVLRVVGYRSRKAR